MAPQNDSNSSGNSGAAELLLLPDSILSNSPSKQDGIDHAMESLHRMFGCELIQEAGQSMQLPQVVVVTAQSILHRFLYRKSLAEFDAFRSAMGSLFLACKIEEQAKSMREVITVFYAIFRVRKCRKLRNKTSIRSRLLMIETCHGGLVYAQWSEWLMRVERQILIDLGFSIYKLMDHHPHKYILYYIKMLNGTTILAQSAWSFLNDSLRIDLCTRVDAQVIACSAILLASRQIHMALPTNPPWWRLFDVSWQQIVPVALEIAQIYTREPIVWLEPLHGTNPFEYAAEDDEEEPQEKILTSGTAEAAMNTFATIDAGENDRGEPVTTQESQQPSLAVSDSAIVAAPVTCSKEEEQEQESRRGTTRSRPRTAGSRSRSRSRVRSSSRHGSSRSHHWRQRSRRHQSRSRSRSRSRSPSRNRSRRHRHNDRRRSRSRSCSRRSRESHRR